MIEEEKLVDLYFRSLIHPDVRLLFLEGLDIFSFGFGPSLDCIFPEKTQIVDSGGSLEMSSDPNKYIGESGIGLIKDNLEKCIINMVFLHSSRLLDTFFAFICKKIFEINLLSPHYVINNFSEYIEIIRYYSSQDFSLNIDDKVLFHSPNYTLTDDIYFHPERYIKYLPGKKKGYTDEELLDISNDTTLPEEVSNIAKYVLGKKNKKKK